MTSRAPTPSRQQTDTSGRRWRVIAGDCLDQLTDLADESIDAVVTDPPYGIDFQGERWDGPAIRSAANANGRRLGRGDAFQHWCQAWARECRRLLKPGGHLVAFGAPRTAHRLAAGIEDAGLELRDTLMWLYGTGMPKSRRLSGGRGTQLKPAYEPIILARRPPNGPVTRNLGRHRTGALNVDACRINGRHPAHLTISHLAGCSDQQCVAGCPVALVDATAALARGATRALGQASRLFYCPKASRRERDTGCEQLPARDLDLFPNAKRQGRKPPKAANAHPTVKPLALMRWLIRLTAPDHGLVLDPFCGSGSTGAAAVLEHRRFLGIELDPTYRRVARARIAHWANHPDPATDPSATTAGERG